MLSKAETTVLHCEKCVAHRLKGTGDVDEKMIRFFFYVYDQYHVNVFFIRVKENTTTHIFFDKYHIHVDFFFDCAQVQCSSVQIKKPVV
jgi:hypothetical protein